MPADFQDTIYRIVGEVLRPADRRHASTAGRGRAAHRRGAAAVLQLRRRPGRGQPADHGHRDLERPERPGLVGAAGRARAADYEALLATCWDAAHAVNPKTNIVSALVSKASPLPNGFTVGYTAPAPVDRRPRRRVQGERPDEADLRHLRLHPEGARLERAPLDTAPRHDRLRDRRLRRARRAADERRSRAPRSRSRA